MSDEGNVCKKIWKATMKNSVLGANSTSVPCNEYNCRPGGLRSD